MGLKDRKGRLKLEVYPDNDADFLALKDPTRDREIQAEQTRIELAHGIDLEDLLLQQQMHSPLSREFADWQSKIDAVKAQRYGIPEWAALDAERWALPLNAWRWASNNTVWGDDATGADLEAIARLEREAHDAAQRRQGVGIVGLGPQCVIEIGFGLGRIIVEARPHQTHNARFIAQRNAARGIDQPQRIAAALQDLLQALADQLRMLAPHLAAGSPEEDIVFKPVEVRVHRSPLGHAQIVSVLRARSRAF